MSNNSSPPSTESLNNAKKPSLTKEKKSPERLKSETKCSTNATLLELPMPLKEIPEMRRDKLSVRPYNYSKLNLDYSKSTSMIDLRELRDTHEREIIERVLVNETIKDWLT